METNNWINILWWNLTHTEIEVSVGFQHLRNIFISKTVRLNAQFQGYSLISFHSEKPRGKSKIFPLMSVEAGQWEHKKAFIKHMCYYWRDWFYQRCFCWIYLSKTNNTGLLFLPGEMLKTLLNFLVTWSLSLLLHGMSLTCSLSLLPLSFAFIMHCFISVW